MPDKILTLLGFASKAGALRFGASAATEAVKRGLAKGVFFAEDISEKSRMHNMAIIIYISCEYAKLMSFRSLIFVF